jgi:hypothetical protein
MMPNEIFPMREMNYSKPIRAILDTIRHEFVWTFGSLLSRETLLGTRAPQAPHADALKRQVKKERKLAPEK